MTLLIFSGGCAFFAVVFAMNSMYNRGYMAGLNWSENELKKEIERQLKIDDHLKNELEKQRKIEDKK